MMCRCTDGGWDTHYRDLNGPMCRAYYGDRCGDEVPESGAHLTHKL